MIILVWYGMAWHGMVWHGMARGAGTLGPYGTLGPRLVPYHAIPYRAMPYHTSIIIFLYYCIFILLYIIILLYYYISDIAYCSLFVVHAPIQHLGHLKDLILCIIFNIFIFCIFLYFLTSDADRNPTFLILLEIFEPLTQNYTFLIILLHRSSSFSKLYS